jgi:stage III sporulation protein AF
MKNLIAYMLLSALVEKLVPGKSYQRYISLTGGLIMIMLLVRPLVSIFGGDDSELIKKIENYIDAADDIDYSLEDITGAVYEAESFLEDKPDYGTAGNEETLRSILKNLGAELENLEIMKDKNGEILRIIVVVSVAYDENAEADLIDEDDNTQIKKCVAEIYNIDTENIYIVRR